MLAVEYYDLCARHDWFFEYSDDHRVWARGREALNTLRRHAAENADFQTIFDAWREHMFSGQPWGTERAPRPKRPSVVTFEGDVPSVHPEQMELSA